MSSIDDTHAQSNLQEAAASRPFSAWDYGCALARSGLAARMGSGASIVLHTIAAHADDGGHSSLSLQRIAQFTGLSVPMVIRHVATLETCCAVAVLRTRDARTHQWETNRYIILPVAGITPPPRQPRAGRRPGEVRRG